MGWSGLRHQLWCWLVTDRLEYFRWRVQFARWKRNRDKPLSEQTDPPSLRFRP
jgi:hypothetical protein